MKNYPFNREGLEAIEKDWIELRPWKRRTIRSLICAILSLFFFVGPLYIFIKIEQHFWLYLTQFLLGSTLLYVTSLLITALSRNRRELTLINTQLKEASLKDSLTGLYNNRDFMNDMIRILIARSRRNNCSFYLLFADIDDLKIINDTYGHPAGDEAIIVAAQAFKDSVREEDYVFRFGGDEILGLICVNDMTNKEAEDIIQKMASRIMQYANRVRIFGRPKNVPDILEQIPFSISAYAHQFELDNDIKGELEQVSKEMEKEKENNKKQRRKRETEKERGKEGRKEEG